jgi:hypothetical protein
MCRRRGKIETCKETNENVFQHFFFKQTFIEELNTNSTPKPEVTALLLLLGVFGGASVYLFLLGVFGGASVRFLLLDVFGGACVRLLLGVYGGVSVRYLLDVFGSASVSLRRRLCSSSSCRRLRRRLRSSLFSWFSSSVHKSLHPRSRRPVIFRSQIPTLKYTLVIARNIF